ELYEIVSDPDEQNNLVREQRALAGQLRDRLLGLEAGFTTHQPLPLAADGQLDAELRSLGYLGGAGETTSGLDPKDGIGLLNELEQANRLLASGQAAAAVRKLEALNAKSPDNVPFLTRLASAQEQAGEIDQAIATFERAISLDPDLEFLHHHLGRTLLNAKRYEAAEAAFEAALEIDPRFSQAWLSLAELALHRGRPADERKVLERAAAREVDSVGVLVRLAQILLAAKELGAERHLARACELLPELPLPWLLRGQAALIEGRREAARSHLERAIQAAPRSSIAGQARALLAQLGR
ncbi:MAG: tetratricopeptide repeat protein, partial [Acidobacteriota bacterium]